jgi:hypothetical protein
MTQINPFTGAVIQSGQVPPRQSANKDRQIRRAQDLAKNTALQGDHLEHQVESTDTLHASDDREHPHQQQRRSSARHGQDGSDPTPHIDLTA